LRGETACRTATRWTSTTPGARQWSITSSGRCAASDALKLSKPDPRIFHHAAASLRLRPEECVHVGDDLERDVQGAAAAGFRPIWLVRGRGPAGPPHVETIESLMKLVGRV